MVFSMKHMRPALKIDRVKDFKITGSGKSNAWKKAQWQTLSRLGEGKLQYPTKVKALYSATGMYFLFDCTDKKLTCNMTSDFDDLYKQDVVEVFLWPEKSQELYFEYEASPLGRQLPILVPNHKGTFFGWLPWHFEGDRRTEVKTSIRGGNKKAMSEVKGWMAEIYIPFTLMKGLRNVPPVAGTTWRTNMYRIDYDQKPRSLWAWSNTVRGTFHDIHNFGTFMFE
ncbi:MAG: hypothetical protein A2283_07445 [Lentisphaerae bacterium RIFOXYA12_FULL_48_11]|nr:MAG: hypothetical protein A2283_07445 [Lentisphaerae bacterium RIFOXYA12_FULL_48_11]